jgi:hypothetical protein
MKKASFLLAVMILAVASAANAYTLSFDYSDVLGLPSSPVAGAIVETFEGPLQWTWLGSFTVLDGTTNQNSAPWNPISSAKETTKYVSVPSPGGLPPAEQRNVTVTNLGGDYNYFGIWWGSMDTYNKLELLFGTNVVATLTGENVADPNATGDQLLPATNRYVNIFLEGVQKFDSFRMTSDNYAFEADNIALAAAETPNPIPEPVSMLLFGTGLVGIGGYLRRKYKK